MFVTCDQCGGRFKIAPEKVPAAGIRARCTGCPSILFLWKEGERVMSSATPALQKHHPAPPPEPRPAPGTGLAGVSGAGLGSVAEPPPVPDRFDGASDDFGEPPPSPEGFDEISDDFGGPPPSPERFDEVSGDFDEFGGGPSAPDGLDEVSGDFREATPALEGLDEVSGGFGELPPDPPPAPDFDFAGMFDDVAGTLEAPPSEPAGKSGGIDFREPSLITGAIRLDEASPLPAKEAQPVREEIPVLEPAPKGKRAQRSRPWPRGRTPQAEGPLSKALWSLVAVAALVYGVLIGLNRDPTQLFERHWGAPEEAQAPMRADDLASGVYATTSGGNLLYLTGTLDLRAGIPKGSAVRVVGELLDPDGGVVARGEGWAGALPTPEELWAVADEAGWERLSRDLSWRAAVSEAAPFLVAFPQARTPAGPFRFRIAASVENAPPGGSVAQDEAAEEEG